jgi:hypothetical protein
MTDERSDESGCVRCSKALDHSTPLCCSSHNKALCHRCYRATHFVEVCRCGLCTMRAAAVGEGV